MRIAITGSEGQIGWELVRALQPIATVSGLTSGDVDLTDSPELRRRLRDINPDLIINAAGYTAVDRAELEPQIATAVNATAVGVIGDEARRLGAAVVHFSTDYVFDGRKASPYSPSDAPNPLSTYAKSKLAGEQALRDSGAAHLIFRTSWIYAARGRNFLLAMLQQAASKPELRIVNDQIGSPTWCRPLARAVGDIVMKSIEGAPGNRSFGGLEGTYHLCAGGSTTWFDFAQRIFQIADVRPLPKLVPITSHEYDARARRPTYSVLDCSKTTETFGVLMDDWDAALQELFRSERQALNAAVSATSGVTR